MTTVVYAVDIKAPAADVFRAVVDWPGQDQWIPLTQVRATAQAGVGVGGEIEAFTGIGKLGFLDTMTITRWDAPLRVDVLHTGAVVRGSASCRFDRLPRLPRGSIGPRSCNCR